MSSGFADDVYLPQPDPDAQDPLEQLDGSDTLVSGPDDLDTGYSPPERPMALRDPETMDERLAEETPDDDGPPADWDGIGDHAGADGELMGDQVGGRRSGRLVAPDEGAHSGGNSDLSAQDVGIDGGAASAEEAAMHVVDDEELDEEYDDAID
ncbi:DUF5709 domain-containing protein [Catenulispora pinisilvae]|uniref:DUF5709 domain-containing protein n=1 Tax=Catenulispora pinisilvae TaxID=2705253 RepID=UPI001891D64A|nr:DUF5709 domain-containing protein [Catenulispora pinisilvae]